MQIVVSEHPSPTYPPRTAENAKGADLTVAFAVDFSTGGERLTHRLAGENYVGCPIRWPEVDCARKLFSAMRQRNARSLNVAGNGMYSMAVHGFTQEDVDAYIFAVLSKVHEHWPIAKVISGGQTGADIAGLSAAAALGIPCAGLWPKGYIQRDAKKVTRNHSRDDVIVQIVSGAERLKAEAAAILTRAYP